MQAMNALRRASCLAPSLDHCCVQGRATTAAADAPDLDLIPEPEPVLRCMP